MKQQINLYQRVERKRREPFCAAHLAWGVAATAIVLVLASAILIWDGERQQAALAELQARQAQLQLQVTELDKRLPEPKIDPALEQELARLEQQLAARRVYLRRFSTDALGNGKGFSNGLAALARQPVKSLWLREIRFYGDGKLAFRGGLKDPEALPAFVAALGKEPVFQGRDFRSLKVERPKDSRYLEFSLQSAGVPQP